MSNRELLAITAKTGDLDLVVAATGQAVMMVESEAKELSEEIMLGAVMFAHEASQKVIARATTLWYYVDVASGRPVAILDDREPVAELI